MILNEKNLNLEELDKVNDVEDTKVLPINMNGVFNRIIFLLLNNYSSIFCEAKVLPNGNTYSINNNIKKYNFNNILVLPLSNTLDPSDPNFETVVEEKLNILLKDIASDKLIDTHYFPKNSDSSKQHLLQRLGFHIEVIYWSTILNFYNMKFIMEQLGIPFECSITKKDVEFNLRYWINKVTSKYIETANNQISEFLNQMNVNENIEQMQYDFQNYYMFCKRLNIYPFLEFMRVREDKIIEADSFRNKLKIRLYRAGKSKEKGYDKIRSIDNQFCLYIPNEMKMKLYRWYKTDMKECRSWVNKELEDSFMIGKVYSESDDEYYGTHFLFRSISKYISTNNIENLSINDIFGLKIELHDWFEFVKKYIKND